MERMARRDCCKPDLPLYRLMPFNFKSMSSQKNKDLAWSGTVAPAVPKRFLETFSWRMVPLALSLRRSESPRPLHQVGVQQLEIEHIWASSLDRPAAYILRGAQVPIPVNIMTAVPKQLAI